MEYTAFTRLVVGFLSMLHLMKTNNISNYEVNKLGKVSSLLLICNQN